MENIEGILKKTSHREYPLPQGRWQQYQEWHDNVLMHWKVEPSFLTGLLPQGLGIDCIDGTAWISVIAFSVKNLHPRGLPPFSFYSDFHEVNVRTYVVRNGIPGIYFLSIEAQKKLPVLLARLYMGLPYLKSDIIRSQGLYISSNEAMEFRLDFDFRPKDGRFGKSQLDVWLTERHALYKEKDGKIYRIDVHHKPWPLQNVELAIKVIRYPFIKMVKDGSLPDKIHYARNLGVVIWGQKKS